MENRPYVPLEKILHENDIVLVDGSADNYAGARELCLFATHYALLHTEDLEEALDSFKKLGAIIGTPRSKTIPEVTEELLFLANNLKKEQDYLDKRNTRKRINSVFRGVFLDSNNPDRHRLKSFQDTLSISQRNRELYHDLVSRVYSCVHLFKTNGIRIIEPGFDEFVEVVKTLDRTIGLKKCTRAAIADPSYSVKNTDTDERLLTTAYWISMFSNKKVAILTKDADFFRLLEHTPKLLGSRDFYPHNLLFRDSLRANPIRLYYRSNGDSCEETTTGKIKYLDGFSLYRAGPEKSNVVREQVSQFFNNLARYHKQTPIKFA